MELTDIIPMSELTRIVEEVHEKFGFRIVFYRPDNSTLASSKEMGNKLCPVIDGNINSLMICSEAKKRIVKDALDSKDVAIDECDAGMIKYVIPIFVNDEYLGSASGCGRLADDAEPVDTFYISKLTERDENEIKELAKSITKVSKDEMKEIISFIQDSINPYINKYLETAKEMKKN